MAWRLIILVAIPTVLGLALTGLRVTDTARNAQAYGQVGRLAVLGQQVVGLTQAMETERADTAAYIAGGRPASGAPALRRQYVITDSWAATVRGRIHRLGGGYPAQTRAATAAVLASLTGLPGLRQQAASGHASALAVINGYSAATAGLLTVNDGIADLSGNQGLVTSVRALGGLSRVKEDVSQQQAILGAALAEGHFGPGELMALAAARAQQASDVASFRSSATPEEGWALTRTLAGPIPRQARALEQHAMAAGPGALALGPQAAPQWQAGMSYTVGWMRHAEQQLSGSITSYAQILQHRAVRSAIITIGAGLAGLVLVVLATLMIARSIVRPLRRLEAAALEVAGAGLPAEVGALGVAGYPVRRLPAAPLEGRSSDEIGQVARAFDRVHREALRLAGEQARLRASVSAVSTSFLRRSHSLLERLLGLIDSSELTEDDPDRLASLFEMDHLATRMRRNTDSALAIAGHGTPYHLAGPVTLVDVLRAAVSEIEQYDRVILDVEQGVSVGGSAAADIVHLLAELLENATTFSSKTTHVIVSGDAAEDGGSLISITDAGVGLTREHLDQLNWELAHPHLPGTSMNQRVGLFAVAHLAARHGIEVTLRTVPDGGTSAEVLLPATLLSREAGGEDPLFWASRFVSGPERPGEGDLEPEPGWEPGPQAGTPYDMSLALGAPLPARGPETSPAVTVPEQAGAEPRGADPAGGQAATGEGYEISRDTRSSLPRGAHRVRADGQLDPAARPGQG